MKTKWMSETSLVSMLDSTVDSRKRPCRQAIRNNESPSINAFDEDHSLRTLQVLVIADQQSTSDRIVARVRRWGHDAHAANNRRSALQKAAITSPHVVLLCGGTPSANWCQLTRRLRLHLPSQDCLMIAITRQAEQQQRQQCIDAGIDLILETPVDLDSVETLLLLECTRLNRFAGQDAVATNP